MIWATVSFWSCFCWLHRASPPLAAKNINNLILVLTIWWCPCEEPSLVLLERVFAMTRVFSWQNPVSLCPVSFCTPRPYLPVILGISWLPMMKRTSFFGVSSKLGKERNQGYICRVHHAKCQARCITSWWYHRDGRKQTEWGWKSRLLNHCGRWLQPWK